MTNYGLDRGDGSAVTTGLPEHTARRDAQRLAIIPELKFECGNPRPSQYTEAPTEDFPRGVLVGAVDVDVVVTIGERRVDGEVTLARNEADGVTLESWGCADNWVSDGLLAALREAADRDEDAVSDMLSHLAAEAAAVGERVAA